MDYYDVCAGSIVTEKGVDQQALEGYFADMLRIHQAERENTPELGDGVSFATMVTFSGGGSGAEVLDPGSNRLRKVRPSSTCRSLPASSPWRTS
ncbi:hypothetical protein LIZ34_12030 [Intestinimonas butyriciproducens]|uniref:hypothetical protein n=1 Tax=Intestinimonas butyriciproducens TaxID=1297617 RepID=UPI00189F2D25|nr:hypothetical protein [Intestinimonas butyriciproducens]MBO3280260.1 hypothetical protein [Intestinimonas butyriciproducens]MBS6523170.1 hypothetical protein [Clostridiales bacterium]MCB7051087.1 hypothetical protein [Intestinimonas butyriciproducens]